nr:immunoglobulin heavy chain junction region [Macaca mulatta]MOW96804.1 immunoglobulin heavy chain junction region [Macaca mulatta]
CAKSGNSAFDFW